MNRNSNSHFSLTPATLGMNRSVLDRSFGVKTTLDSGLLTPLAWDEIYPGDTCKITTSKVVRLQTMLDPIFDNIYFDTYWFFVPFRLLWEHWKQFMGENTDSAWYPETMYRIPQMKTKAQGAGDINDVGKVNSVWDYLGLPLDVAGLSVSALPFRAYSLIWNEFFRSEALQDPLNIYKGDSDKILQNSADPNDDPLDERWMWCRPVGRFADYFSSALPAPQYGPSVSIPMSGDVSWLPVHTLVETTGQVDDVSLCWWNMGTNANYPFTCKNSNETNIRISPTDPSPSQLLYPNNLWAKYDLENVTMANINDLRTAFQIQKLYEKEALSGNRYIETIFTHFKVRNPDFRLQRPEYLGGNRIPLNIHQVANTSQAVGSPLGDLGAYSQTSDVHDDILYSASEHGILMCVACARWDASYEQGIERAWSRKDKLDFYFPVMANLGNMAVKVKEIYAQGTSDDEEVWGYQEAWADLRYKPSRNTGLMRAAVNGGFGSWHLGDVYGQRPYLSDEWLRTDKANLDRCLAVTSSASNQIFADFWFKYIHTRVLPVYSIPGLIDHH